MQFYKEHISLDLDTRLSDIIFSNDECITNNRAIISDNVYIIDNEVVGIKERNLKHITGILYLDSKIKYGTFKDKSLFMFKPTDRSYPNYYIPYIKNKIYSKIYCIIQFKEWKISDRLPIGTLLEIIGDVGNKEAEYEHLRFYYGLRNNNWRYKTEASLDLNSKTPDYEVFSIDPIGSKDIDDAFHFNENLCEVGIHIASPSKYFKDDMLIILDRVSTIYLPDKKYNMLPNNYADNIISLIENHNRYAISLILTFDKEYNIVSSIIKESIVKNIKNYDYDEYDKCDKCDKIHFLKLSEGIFKTPINDSHKLVELWMILANKEVAKYLIDRDISNLILRKHDYNEKSITDNLDAKLVNHLNIKKESSASYEIYDPNKIQTHSKLNNEYYTHFTSPIRRAVDFYIHMLILKGGDILERDELQKIIDKINIFTKNSRRFSRNVQRLEFLFKIKGSNIDIDINTYAYIINIDINRITVYIPEYNLEEKITIIHRKVESIANYDYGTTYIKYRIDDKEFYYKIYDKIDIKLWVLISAENIFDKLKIEIL